MSLITFLLFDQIDSVVDCNSPSVVHDSVKAVSDGQDSAIFELCANC